MTVVPEMRKMERASPSLNGPRLVLAGAAPDTGNLGVSALAYATIEGLLSRVPRCELTVLDFGTGLRRVEDAEFGEYWRCGAKHSRRLHRPETMWNIRVAATLGGLNNPAARRILHADVMLDISGGDSFSDLYGPRRFRAVAMTKQLAIRHGIPLILLPQTYGPFESEAVRREASQIVARSAMAWARDDRSYEAMRGLLGPAYDSGTHLSGVDVAFLLKARTSVVLQRGEVADLLQQRDAGGAKHEVVGVNVSGLLYNQPESAARQYGLRASYNDVVVKFVRRLLDRTNAAIVLMPHVVTARGHYESDVEACEAVLRAVGDSAHGRVVVAPALEHPGEAKGVIGRFDWFCGTRMHATIAGLSSGVPTSAVAYSPKTLGVFETCGQGEHVADPRTLDTTTMVERLWKSWEERAEAKRALASALPRTLERAREQMDRIAALCVELSRAGVKGVASA